MSTLSLYSTTARDAAMAAIGADTVGDQEVSLLKQIFVAAGNSSGGGGGGTGNVVGPASSTDHAVARFDLATGKLLQNSVVLISDLGAMSGVTQLTIAQGTITAQAAGLSTGVTWNNAGVTFAGNTNDVTATASATLSLLEVWRVGGVAKAGIVKDGAIFADLGIWKSAAASYNGSGFHGLEFQNSAISFYVPSGVSALPFLIGPSGGGLNDLGVIVSAGIGFGGGLASSTIDAFLMRRGAANFQLGRDSASPISQALGVAAGVGADINGAHFTIAGGIGTGSGTPGELRFQTSTALGSNSTAQTLSTRLSISADTVVVASGVGLQLGNTAIAETPTASHTLIIKDATDTEYKILCVPV